MIVIRLFSRCPWGSHVVDSVSRGWSSSMQNNRDADCAEATQEAIEGPFRPWECLEGGSL